MRIRSRYVDIKLFLASKMTSTGIRKVQCVIHTEHLNTRNNKHIQKGKLGSKSNRRKKKKEKPYGDAIAKVKFWTEVCSFRKMLDLQVLPDFTEELEEETRKLFPKYATGLELQKDKYGRLLVVKTK